MRRQYSNHSLDLAVERNRAAHNRRLALEFAFPQPMAQEHDRRPSRAIFAAQEVAPGPWNDTQHRKEVRGHLHDFYADGIARTGQVAVAPVHEPRERLE